MASSSLKAVSRLVTNTHKPLATGATSEIRRNFGTTGILRKSNYTDVEERRGSLYHLIWKRKFMWLFVFGGIGYSVYEVFRPDKGARKEAWAKEMAQLGGAYNPLKPQKENPVATPKTETPKTE